MATGSEIEMLVEELDTRPSMAVSDRIGCLRPLGWRMRSERDPLQARVEATNGPMVEIGSSGFARRCEAMTQQRRTCQTREP